MIYRPDHRDTGSMFDGLIVDLFAGGGGASMGIESALGRAVDVAINHDAEAVAMHQVNHPATRHVRCDVWEADPVEIAAGRPVDLLWASPDCTFFSKARGAKPIRDKGRKSRSLAWVVTKWAGSVRPRVIMLENVEEFRDWGPLAGDGRPCPKRKGTTYRRWKRQLENMGYEVRDRELRACDYGAPTIRRRLFLIARCDGAPIIWPERTHGPMRSKSRTEEGNHISGAGRARDRNRSRATAGADEPRVSRPHRRHDTYEGQQPELLDRTLRPYRTAAECIDWSLPCPSIFTRKRPLAEKTLRRIANGIRRYVIEATEPFIVRLAHGDHANGKKRWGKTDHPLGEPLPTVTGSKDFALVAPILAQHNGEAPHQDTRGQQPFGTVMTENHQALAAAFLAKHNGGATGQPLTEPVHTLAGHINRAVVAAHLTKLRGTCKAGQPVDDPAPTLTAGGNHAGLVYAFLAAYYGNDRDGQGVRDPLRTVTTKDRMGVVTVNVRGEPYIIADIGMRMLAPRELYRAHGFPDSYVIDPVVNGRRLPKSAQVRMCGNSVCPPLAEALVKANCLELAADMEAA